ncbi:histidine kinase [Aliiroseovarius zhejiangensis]|uniref:histidine kinase n=1 Tax=Aliiroseovarius zhejiangensis TaxID=1632025 RepID=A0ABQ3ITQ4_9RHOB|nr:HAMP domain-containing sensor histidine kinase [Aliiroseovarius zhejiangensis]GHE94111.1 histidine kinase [Aliiroseovarius zhejiangensis]
MTSSLSLRLLLLAMVSTSVALVSTALFLNLLFQEYFEDRIAQELDTHLFMITGHLGIDDTGAVALAPIADPRFDQPLSGYYWQIQINDDPPMLSPSFWAAPLDVPRPQAQGQVQYDRVEVDAETPLSLASWRLSMGDPTHAQDVFVMVAMDRSDIDLSAAGFFRSSALWLAIMGAVLILAAWVQVRLGLKPLEKIRAEVTQIMTSSNSRLSHDYPREVQPLAREVNNLLDANETALEKARTHSGNLAHGLKTPLTILQNAAHTLRGNGEAQIATHIETELENMRHIVERELASVRNSATARRYSRVKPSAQRLVNVLKQQPNAAHITWELDLVDDVLAPFDPHDLTELLGNLMDNAMKWTRDHIRVSATHDGDRDVLRIDDNGPGISESLRGLVLERGKQLSDDQTRAATEADAQAGSELGAGLGLTIVHDMAKTAGCTLDLSRSPFGGLSVGLSWPRFSP